MSKLILETGVDNEMLRRVAKAVTIVDKKLVRFVADMKVAMDDENGIGLAAPQVGHSIRVAVVMLDCESENPKTIGLINPEITHFSKETILGEEGCLSIPGFFDNVERSKEIVVKYLNEKGQEQMLRLEDLNARVVQHEIDHLNGILFVDLVDESNSSKGKKSKKGGNAAMMAGAL